MRRISIVDDQDFFRRILCALVASRVGWIMCGQASEGLQAVKQAKLLLPDVIIMDLLTPIIRKDVPESRILIISQDDPSIAQRQTMEPKAHGFLAKADLPHDLLPAIERILSEDGRSRTEKAS